MGVKELPSGYTHDVLVSRPRFGSKDDEQAQEKKCKTARERQKVRIAVAPSCSVTTVGDVVRKAGEELTVQEVGGRVNLEQLEKISVAIHLTESEFKINNGLARHVVTDKAIIGAKKILSPGTVVEASDFAKDDEPAFTYTNTQGHHRTAEPVTYPTGEETLRRLVKVGFVKELRRQAAVQKAIKEARGE